MNHWFGQIQNISSLLQQMLLLFLFANILIGTLKVSFHIIQDNIRTFMSILGILMELWILFAFFMIIPSDNSRILIYYRYINFTMHITCCCICMKIVLLLGHPEETKTSVWTWNACCAVYIALILFFCTNELHQQVYFIESVSGEILYRNNWGLYLSLGLMFLLNFGTGAILSLKVIRNHLVRSSFLIVIYWLYFLVYFFHFDDVLEITNGESRTIFYLCFQLVYLVAIYGSGLLITNSNYQELFDKSGLKMSIRDKDGNLLYGSEGMHFSKYSIEKQMIADYKEGNVRSYLFGKSKVLYMHKIVGGYAFYEENIKTVKKLLDENEVALNNTKKINALLAKESNQKHQEAKARVVKELMDGLEEIIHEKLEGLQKDIDTLKLKDAEGISQEEHLHYMAHIMLRMVFIKRQCMLYFVGQQSDYVPADELTVYIDEMADLGKYAKIKCATANRIKSPLPVQSAALFYDFFARILSVGRILGEITIIEEFNETPTQLEMHLIASQTLAEKVEFSAKFQTLQNNLGGKLEQKELDDVVDISFILPKEIKSNDLPDRAAAFREVGESKGGMS